MIYDPAVDGHRPLSWPSSSIYLVDMNIKDMIPTATIVETLLQGLCFKTFPDHFPRAGNVLSQPWETFQRGKTVGLGSPGKA